MPLNSAGTTALRVRLFPSRQPRGADDRRHASCRSRPSGRQFPRSDRERNAPPCGAFRISGPPLNPRMPHGQAFRPSAVRLVQGPAAVPRPGALEPAGGRATPRDQLRADGAADERQPARSPRGDRRARSGRGPRARRHRQDLPCHRQGRRGSRGRPGRPHPALPSRGRGRGEPRLSAGRPAGEAGALSPAALRRAQRPAGRQALKSCSPTARSRSRRSPTCAAAPSTTPSW